MSATLMLYLDIVPQGASAARARGIAAQPLKTCEPTITDADNSDRDGHSRRPNYRVQCIQVVRIGTAGHQH